MTQNTSPSSAAAPVCGTVYGLGLGPGDPELMTLKAQRLLKHCPVIAYPAAEGLPSLVRSIAEPFLPPQGQIEIEMAMPMAVARFPAQSVYDRAAEEIREHSKQGRDVAVLCEGDPLFYGSFMYLYQRLAGQVPIQIVPGVTSVAACASAIQLPLVARNDVLTVLPGPLDNDTLLGHLQAAQAVAIMKVGRHFARLKDLLEAHDMIDQAWYVERASMAQQKVMPLKEAGADAAPYFSMILVHKRGRADA